MTDLRYPYAINFRMYINLIQLPVVFLFLGVYHFAGYNNVIQKIKEIGFDVIIFGIVFGIGSAL